MNTVPAGKNSVAAEVRARKTFISPISVRY
jgi:hypothetical protein